jgi:hypothetical protein
MTLIRILAVACAVAVTIQSQNVNGQTVQIPVYQPQPEIPAGTRFLAENVETIGWVWAVVAGVAVVAIVGGIALTLWAKSRQTNDPLRLALADPWMRAKIEAMSEQERAAFFGQKT